MPYDWLHFRHLQIIYVGWSDKFVRQLFHVSDSPTNRKPSFTTSVSPLSIAGPDFSVPLKTNFNSFKTSSSDPSSESSSTSDKISCNLFEVEGCCVSGIWCVYSFDTSMSESSSLSLSFSNNFRFQLIFLSLVFLSHEEDRPLLHSKIPTRKHKSVIPRWISRNISVSYFFQNTGRSHYRWMKRARPAQRSVVSVAVALSPHLIWRGIQPSKIVQIWWVCHSNCCPQRPLTWATHIPKYFTGNWLIRLFEKWVTLNYSKTKDIKVPKFCRANNVQTPSKHDNYACPNRFTAPYATYSQKAILNKLKNPCFHKFKKVIN